MKRRSAGDPNDWTATSSSTACYWHIVAPPDRQIEFYLTSTPDVCMETCPWQSREINVGQFNLFGMITCCPSLIGVIMASQGNLVTIRGATRYNRVAFGIMYRLVPVATTSTSSSSTPPTITSAAYITTSTTTGTSTVQRTTIGGSPLNTTTLQSITVGITTTQTTATPASLLNTTTIQSTTLGITIPQTTTTTLSFLNITTIPPTRIETTVP